MLSNVWHSWVMVGRFIANDGGGEHAWSVRDNASNGERGDGLTESAARQLAADLELQYDAHGQRDPGTVFRRDPPVPVDAYQPVGVLDRWLKENGQWVGRVCRPDGRIVFIPQSELRERKQD